MDLTEYRALVAKVDAFFARVTQRFPAEMTCHSGCSGCCHVRLTVSEVEAEAIRLHVLGLPEEERARVSKRAPAGASPGPSACAALEEDGRCAIYEARPIICRTQGVPMRVAKPGALPVLDVCPLNFEGKALEGIDADCVLDVQTIDTLLGVVNARACAAADTQKRTKIEDVLFSAHPR